MGLPDIARIFFWNVLKWVDKYMTLNDSTIRQASNQSWKLILYSVSISKLCPVTFSNSMSKVLQGDFMTTRRKKAKNSPGSKSQLRRNTQNLNRKALGITKSQGRTEVQRLNLLSSWSQNILKSQKINVWYQVIFPDGIKYLKNFVHCN